MKKLWLFLFCITALILFTNEAHATHASYDTIECPVCSNSFKTQLLTSSNSFGGHDRDLMKYASGDQPILISPITCNKCYYSGYENDFKASEANLSDAIKKAILSEKNLKPCHAPIKDANSLSGAGHIPAFARYDLIAQSYKLRGKDSEEIFGQYLSASWAARMEAGLLINLNESVKLDIYSWVEKNIETSEITAAEKNAAYVEIIFARRLVEKAKKTTGPDLEKCLMGAILLFRDHGENAEVEKLLPILQKSMAAEKFEKFAKILKETIEIERNFQKKAIEILMSKLESGKKIKYEDQKAYLYYIVAELSRRTLEYDKAKIFYKKAGELNKLPPPIDKYVKEQLELCN